jgi:mannosyltransferase OCH1-like enzyme
MKIPKKIHYCWLGDNPLPELTKSCMETWKEYLPDYEIKLWNEANMPNNQYMHDMLKNKQYAFASDYLRFYALYHEGGIYLDTDMEIIKSLDTFLYNECFLGYESDKFISAGIIGGQKNHSFFHKMMIKIENNYEVNKKEETIPKLITELLDEDVDLKNKLKLYSVDVFYPYNPYRNSVKQLMYKDITKNTYAIHHWNYSWKKSRFEKIISIIKRILK